MAMLGCEIIFYQNERRRKKNEDMKSILSINTKTNEINACSGPTDDLLFYVIKNNNQKADKIT